MTLVLWILLKDPNTPRGSVDLLFATRDLKQVNYASSFVLNLRFNCEQLLGMFRAGPVQSGPGLGWAGPVRSGSGPGWSGPGPGRAVPVHARPVHEKVRFSISGPVWSSFLFVKPVWSWSCCVFFLSLF